ncbi:hypothetical protein [Synechococcus sp. BA-132 BA5]|uniref:hypothetical protein n=1 Tax=Synechococcus sp. BA-132 BA5 TaxID=3110252 RepID=UPI002B20F300|nr:hypothetical protein [Synechococcus sp. BA-132 BA5]MEA5413873.1 hypothetical protein [Synechococcus sp. BA-132 BA5]
MNKTGLIKLTSWPLSGACRKWLKQLFSAINQSRGTTIFRVFIHAHATDTTDANPAALSAEQLAYAIPRHKILSEEPTIQRARVGTQQQLGLPLLACLYWLETPSLQLRFPMPMRRSGYEAWWHQQGPKHYKEADRALEAAARDRDSSPSAAPFSEKAFGVNLIGHAYSVFGLGEYLRMIAKALEAADVPFCVVNIPVSNGAPTTDSSLESKIISTAEERPYAFTLYCTTALTHLHVSIHETAFSQTYSIAVWFWEFDRWPKRLIGTVNLVHEHWPCTELIHRALESGRDSLAALPSSVDDCQPIITIPPVVDLGGFPAITTREIRACARNRFGLNQEAVLFTFSFDLNSMIARKNPEAVIKAFQTAFPIPCENSPAVGLVVKSFPPRKPEPRWEHLKGIAASDTRITIIEEDLDRDSILTLYGCCDAFVSLHRSEGLGLGMAEALQLGLDVIATDYGGNVDFCAGPLAHPISYQLIPVKEGEYPDHEGMIWAEPDLNHAVEVMQSVATNRSRQPFCSPAWISDYRNFFSANRVGIAMRDRLTEIWKQRREIQEKIDGNISVSA